MYVVLDDYGPAAELTTDLVNTSPLVWSGTEKLHDAEDLRALLTEHGWERPDGPVSASDLADVQALRTRVRTVLDTPDATLMAAAASDLTRAAAGPLDLGTTAAGRAQWRLHTRTGATLAERVAMVAGVGVLGVLRLLGPERFRDCSSERCSGVFIDVSRAGRRRYCMPALCGNRINVARHRARRSASGTA